MQPEECRVCGSPADEEVEHLYAEIDRMEAEIQRLDAQLVRLRDQLVSATLDAAGVMDSIALRSANLR